MVVALVTYVTNIVEIKAKNIIKAKIIKENENGPGSVQAVTCLHS